jgi:NTE family protein
MQSAFRAALGVALVFFALLDGSSAHAQATAEALRPRTCLVLSGGGARGIAHVGVLKVLEELRVPIDCIVGTSMGAIIGGAYASGKSPAEIESIIRAIDWDLALADEPARPQRSVRAKQLDRARITRAEFGLRGLDTVVLPLGLVVGQQLESVLRQMAGPPAALESFDALPIPFRAIATDIESGRMVVMDRGNLQSAMRASMSVPGIFAPQPRDGRLLLDGGLVRNLGIDVARAMGAERIIAVSLGTPLLGRERLDSLLGVTEQMLNILTEQNVAASLAQLRAEDVLIQPQLGDFSAADFRGSPVTIEKGELGARWAADRLVAFAVPPEQFAIYLAGRAARGKTPAEFERVVVDTDGLGYVNPDSVQAIFSAASANRPQSEGLQRGVEALFATDDFELVGLRAEDEGPNQTLVVEPREKSWGPTYGRLGLTLSTDGEGGSRFNFLADVRATWLNRRALEWRATASIGDLTSLETELLQPFDRRHRWFVAVGVDLGQRLEDIFIEDESIARFRSRGYRAGFDLGRYLGSVGEARIGYEYRRTSLRKVTGLPAIPEVEEDIGAARAGLVLDRLDHSSFPQSGYFASLGARIADTALGGEIDYERYELELQKAFGSGPHGVLLAALVGESRGEQLPFIDAFDLGGFQTLSGASERQYLGRDVRFARASYRYRLARLGGFLSNWYAGGSIEAGRMEDRLNGPRDREARLAGSLFIAADTAFGPLYLGGGAAEGGDRALYLFLGRP